MTTTATPTKDALEKNLRGSSATDGWDVLVAYQERPLNDLLAEHWAKSSKTKLIPIIESFPIDDDEVIKKHYDIQLSAPSLKFSSNTVDGIATLTFDINGTYYTALDEKKPKKIHTIPQDEYGLEINVPIGSITGDGQEHQPTDTAIEFKDDTVAQHYIVLHFQNKLTNWQMKKKDETKKLPTDDEMRKVSGDIALWLGDANNIKWIDFRLAEVTNVKDTSTGATDTDYLRPRSFVLSTAKGVLMVFIRTKSEKDGRVPARFNHKGSGDMLPIPVGSEACIIISQSLFAKFVSDQIYAHCRENLLGNSSVTVNETVDSGIEWSLVLSAGKSWNIGNNIGLQKYSIKQIDVDFAKNPLIFSVADDGNLVPMANWKFDFSATAKWYLDDDAAGVARYGVGLTEISANMSKQGKQFGTLSGDTILLELDFETESPPIKLKALNVSAEGHYPANNSDDDIPRAFRQIAITLPAFKAKLDGLSFFAAQNVLVPGIEFIKPSEVIVPHDVVVLGTMPRSKPDPGTAPAFMSLAAMPAVEATASARSNGSNFPDFLDELYSNDSFLCEFLDRGISGEPQDIYALLAEKGYDFDIGHAMGEVQELITPGPNFDLRFAGGVYEVVGSDAKHQILIHPVHRTIFVDGHTVAGQTRHEDGRITFKSRRGGTNFVITFHREHDGSSNQFNNLYSLQGLMWNESQAEADAIPIGGQRVFPWHGENTAMGKITRADTEGFKSLAMSLDLVNFAGDGNERDAGTRSMIMMVLMAEPTTAVVASVLGIVVAVWAIDKAAGEGWKRWKKRANRFKKFVINANKNGFMKALKSSTSKARLKEASKNMEEIMDRIINHNLDKSTESDIDVDTVLEQTKSDVDKQVAEFIYSGFEIAARKSFKGLFTMDQEAAAETLKKTIKDGLGQWVNEDAYKEYLTVKVKRIVAERDRIALLTKSGGLDRRIRAAETEIKRTEKRMQDMEAAKEEEAEKIVKEEGLSEEDAKKKVEENIKELADEVKEKQEEKARTEAEKERADERADAFTKEIEVKKRQEETHREEVWKKGE
ncbi:hypothetical protein V8C37DRAFT_270604 [Trichoderma ceciliae]